MPENKTRPFATFAFRKTFAVHAANFSAGGMAQVPQPSSKEPFVDVFQAERSPL